MSAQRCSSRIPASCIEILILPPTHWNTTIGGGIRVRKHSSEANWHGAPATGFWNLLVFANLGFGSKRAHESSENWAHGFWLLDCCTEKPIADRQSLVAYGTIKELTRLVSCLMWLLLLYIRSSTIIPMSTVQRQNIYRLIPALVQIRQGITLSPLR